LILQVRFIALWRRLFINLADVPFGLKHYTITAIVSRSAHDQNPWQGWSLRHVGDGVRRIR
jgi:hypothetical protein